MDFNEHRKILNDLKRFEASVPKMVAEIGGTALNHFIMSFRNQGFTDKSLEKWKSRKKLFYRTRSGKKVNDQTRGILIGTGNLRKLRKVNQGKYSVFIRSNDITNNYARVHNEELRAGRGNGFTMPKRQFVGYSSVMNDKIQAKINTIIKQCLKQ